VTKRVRALRRLLAKMEEEIMVLRIAFTDLDAQMMAIGDELADLAARKSAIRKCAFRLETMGSVALTSSAAKTRAAKAKEAT
jgi:hypothetical protein